MGVVLRLFLKGPQLQIFHHSLRTSFDPTQLFYLYLNGCMYVTKPQSLALHGTEYLKTPKALILSVNPS